MILKTGRRFAALVTNRGDIVRWNDNQVLPSDASSCAIKKKLKLNNYQHVPTVLDICDNSRKFSPSRYKKYIIPIVYLPLSIKTFSVCMMYYSFIYPIVNCIFRLKSLVDYNFWVCLVSWHFVFCFCTQNHIVLKSNILPCPRQSIILWIFFA